VRRAAGTDTEWSADILFAARMLMSNIRSYYNSLPGFIHASFAITARNKRRDEDIRGKNE
jgi:hypothetical protein